MLCWPLVSPDINPIEHLWNELGWCVRQQQNSPCSVADLTQALQHHWVAIPQVFTCQLCLSVPCHFQAVLEDKLATPNTDTFLIGHVQMWWGYLEFFFASSSCLVLKYYLFVAIQNSFNILLNLRLHFHCFSVYIHLLKRKQERERKFFSYFILVVSGAYKRVKKRKNVIVSLGCQSSYISNPKFLKIYSALSYPI